MTDAQLRAGSDRLLAQLNAIKNPVTPTSREPDKPISVTYAGQDVPDPTAPKPPDDRSSSINAYGVDDTSSIFDNYLNYIKDAPYSHGREDLVRGNSQTNLNGQDYSRTLRNQRLIDMMNNRVYMPYEDIGNRGAQRGGGADGAGIENKQPFRMPKIETEETRQMERLRKREATSTERQINRQENFRDQSALLNQMAQYERLNRAGKLSEQDRQNWKHAYDTWYLQTHEAAFQFRYMQAEDRFKKYLTDIEIKDVQQAKFLKLWQEGRHNEAVIIANMYNQGYGPLPGFIDIANEAMMRQLADQISAARTPEDYQRIFEQAGRAVGTVTSGFTNAIEAARGQ